MSVDASLSCGTCGTVLPSGASVCPRDGTPVPGAEPVVFPTETIQPAAAHPAPRQTASPAPLPEQPAAEDPKAALDAIIGQQLGDYVVRRRIGSGGMGVVYEGEHARIGRKVAIKFIRADHAQSAHARDLLAEARAAGAIRHPGIIDVFGFGTQPGVGQYLVMEYLEGHPLSELIRQRAPMPLAEALPLLCEVLDALSAAHAMGVVHRDLKPSNIFVARQSNGAERIKVLDFGLAKQSSAPDGSIDQTHSNVVVGTPQYMAPEQAVCEPVGPQTDLYALGLIAFEVLTGQRPFAGRSQMEVMAHHLTRPAPAPSSVVPQPPGVDDLILRLLAKQPAQRPASASQVAQEMRALLSEQDGSGGAMPRTISRPIPVVTLAPAAAALPNEATATVSPLASTPPLKLAALQPPSTSGATRRGWPVAAGVLALAVGVGVILRRQAAEPSAAAPPSPVATLTVTSPSQPAVATPSPLPPASSTDAAERAEPPKPVAATTPRANKKPAKSVQPAADAARRAQPASTSAGEVPPVATPPKVAAPAVEQEALPERTANGTLHLVVRGAWADVWIDGQKLGRVPPQNRYPLTPGEHELELRNPNLAAYRRTLVIAPSGVLLHTADFTATAPNGAAP
jgi:serine/threonine-protein kinase